MSHGECSAESSVNAIEDESETVPLDVDVNIEEEDQMQSPRTFFRSKYTQTTAFKPTTRSVKTQTFVDTTSSFFHERKQFDILPMETVEPEGKSHSVAAETKGVQQSELKVEKDSSASKKKVRNSKKFTNSGDIYRK